MSQPNLQFEDTEVLIKHSELILAYLEKILNEFREDGKIMSKVKGQTGSALKKFASEYVDALLRNANLPTVSGSVAELRDLIAADLASSQCIQLLDYACRWIQLTQDQLVFINSNIREFDLRWNYPLTIAVCKLFTAYCKICLYIHYIKTSSFLVNIFCSSNLIKTYKLILPIDELLRIVKSCIDNPFGFIATQNDPLKGHLSILVFQILPFFSTLFADWPIFNWSSLSIFEFSPEDTFGNSTSMPLDDFTYLANINMFQEFITFFLMVFPSYMDIHPQFTYLASGVITESQFFYLSRNYAVKAADLIVLSLQNQTNKTNQTLPFLRDNLEKTIELKNMSTHIYRMKQLIYLAEDLENFAGIDINQFIRSIHQIRAICAFSFYEIEVFLRMRDQKFWDKEHIETVTKLFLLVDKISSFFVREKHTFERFFVFNLSTADSEYLQTLISNFTKDQSGNGPDAVILKGAAEIHSSIQKLDLNEFDNNTRYDFLPLILTQNRLLFEYNKMATQFRISYLNPLFEHFATIQNHCAAAMDATRYFLDCCPLHTLWRHYTQFINIVKCDHTPMNNSIAFLNIFSFFNYDNIILPCYTGLKANLRSTIQNVRGMISQQIRTVMNKLITDKHSAVTKFSYNNPISCRPIFDPPHKAMLNKEYCLSTSSKLANLTQANQFISSIPESIIYFGEKIDLASFFMSSFSKEIIRILLFCLHDNLHAIIDSAQFIWGLFGQAGLDFSQALANGILNESMFGGPAFTDQSKLFTDLSLPLAPQGVIDEQRVVYKLSSELRSFIENDHKLTKYTYSTQQFLPLTPNEKQAINPPELSNPSIAAQISDASLLYSKQYFVNLIRTLGLHAGIYLDCAIIKIVILEMMKIVDGYRQFSTSSNKSNTLSDPAESLLRVAVGLTLRNNLRTASAAVIEETIPGFNRIIESINSQQTDELMTIKEIITDEKSIFFISKYLSQCEKCTADIKGYFNYIAAMILSIKWDKVIFLSDNDALSLNYHLLPFAFELLVETAPLLFEKSNPENISQGIDSYFVSLSAYTKPTKPSEYNSFYIFMDHFAKFIRGFDYNKISKMFPYTTLSTGYPVSDAKST